MSPCPSSLCGLERELRSAGEGEGGREMQPLVACDHKQHQPKHSGQAATQQYNTINKTIASRGHRICLEPSLLAGRREGGGPPRVKKEDTD